MYLMYYLDDTSNKRVYTMAKVDPFGRPTFSAHPARFSPDDRYANERIMIKKRFGLLLTQRNADGGGGSSQQNGCTK
ncbi:nop10 ribonucleoprotein [Dermatophagoides farinae]|nr:H/ACA ribonucleoprotein complex subunit 3-like [Dermatophagoides farinae]KAH7641255.1 h/aca ribonucleoprotein complex protein-like protein [Dermatophagoides farinae]